MFLFRSSLVQHSSVNFFRTEIINKLYEYFLLIFTLKLNLEMSLLKQSFKVLKLLRSNIRTSAACAKIDNQSSMSIFDLDSKRLQKERAAKE